MRVELFAHLGDVLRNGWSKLFPLRFMMEMLVARFLAIPTVLRNHSISAIRDASSVTVSHASLM